MAENQQKPTLCLSYPPLVDVLCSGLDWRVERELGIAKLQIFSSASMELEKVMGLSVAAPRRQMADNGIHVAWIAPGECLLIGDHAKIAAHLSRISKQGDDEVLAIDLSQGRTSFLVGGPNARDALSALCPLDLSNEAFPVDSVARSSLGETNAFIARLPDLGTNPQFRMIVDQTMAAYVARLVAGLRLSQGD